VDIGEEDYVKIRLACADTPELHYRNYQQLLNNHPIGEIAAIQIQEILAAYPTVDLKCYENSFDRKVCHIFFGGLDLSFLLIQSGYAYASESYPYCRGKQYKRAQEEARKQHLGLWGYGDWDNPAEWRKNTKTYCNNKEFKNCSKSK